MSIDIQTLIIAVLAGYILGMLTALRLEASIALTVSRMPRRMPKSRHPITIRAAAGVGALLGRRPPSPLVSRVSHAGETWMQKLSLSALAYRAWLQLHACKHAAFQRWCLKHTVRSVGAPDTSVGAATRSTSAQLHSWTLSRAVSAGNFLTSLG